MSAVCDVSTVGSALCSRHTRLIIDPGWLRLIPAQPGKARSHMIHTLVTGLDSRGDQLSDVSPQQNDNEIYNAAFSLSHNLGIPTLLQPSLLTSEITIEADKDYTIMSCSQIRHLTVHVNTNQESKLF